MSSDEEINEAAPAPDDDDDDDVVRHSFDDDDDNADKDPVDEEGVHRGSDDSDHDDQDDDDEDGEVGGGGVFGLSQEGIELDEQKPEHEKEAHSKHLGKSSVGENLARLLAEVQEKEKNKHTTDFDGVYWRQTMKQYFKESARRWPPKKLCGLFLTKGYYKDWASDIQVSSHYFTKYLLNEISEDELTKCENDTYLRIIAARDQNLPEADDWESYDSEDSENGKFVKKLRRKSLLFRHPDLFASHIKRKEEFERRVTAKIALKKEGKKEEKPEYSPFVGDLTGKATPEELKEQVSKFRKIIEEDQKARQENEHRKQAVQKIKKRKTITLSEEDSKKPKSLLSKLHLPHLHHDKDKKKSDPKSGKDHPAEPKKEGSAKSPKTDLPKADKEANNKAKEKEEKTLPTERQPRPSEALLPHHVHIDSAHLPHVHQEPQPLHSILHHDHDHDHDHDKHSPRHSILHRDDHGHGRQSLSHHDDHAPHPRLPSHHDVRDHGSHSPQPQAHHDRDHDPAHAQQHPHPTAPGRK